MQNLHQTEADQRRIGMYDSRFEQDNCGIGAVVNIKGIKSHGTVDNALKIVENLEHRAGKDAEGKTGDGVGILLQISHRFFEKAARQLGIQLGNERDYGIGMFFFPQDEMERNQRCRPIRPFSEEKHWMLCRALCRHLLNGRKVWQKDWTSTGSYILSAGYLSSQMTIPM